MIDIGGVTLRAPAMPETVSRGCWLFYPLRLEEDKKMKLYLYKQVLVVKPNLQLRSLIVDSIRSDTAVNSMIRRQEMPRDAKKA